MSVDKRNTFLRYITYGGERAATVFDEALSIQGNILSMKNDLVEGLRISVDVMERNTPKSLTVEQFDLGCEVIDELKTFINLLNRSQVLVTEHQTSVFREKMLDTRDDLVESLDTARTMRNDLKMKKILVIIVQVVTSLSCAVLLCGLMVGSLSKWGPNADKSAVTSLFCSFILSLMILYADHYFLKWYEVTNMGIKFLIQTKRAIKQVTTIIQNIDDRLVAVAPAEEN